MRLPAEDGLLKHLRLRRTPNIIALHMIFSFRPSFTTQLLPYPLVSSPFSQAGIGDLVTALTKRALTRLMIDPPLPQQQFSSDPELRSSRLVGP